MLSWLEWQNEKEWQRSSKQIDVACSVQSSAVTRECYRKIVHPKRRELLEILQQSDTATSCGVNVNVNDDGRHVVVDDESDRRTNLLMGNIAVAAPLMKTTRK